MTEPSDTDWTFRYMLKKNLYLSEIWWADVMFGYIIYYYKIIKQLLTVFQFNIHVYLYGTKQSDIDQGLLVTV